MIINLNKIYRDRMRVPVLKYSMAGNPPGRVNAMGGRYHVDTSDGPDGVSWQILESPVVRNHPITKFELVRVNN